MSDSDENPRKGPPPPTDETSAQETEQSDAPPKNRTRSQSRRARRQKQQKSGDGGGKGKEKKPKIPDPVEEDTAAEELEEGEDEAQAGPMQPFQHIGPDSTSMDGPVTYSRAQRGEIPMRPGNPQQALKTGNPAGNAGEGAVGQKSGGGGGESEMMKQDGLKLRLELNLDIEIELKAKIYGDLTLALLS